MILRLGHSCKKVIREKNMKNTVLNRVLSITLISALLLSTAACGKKNSGKAEKKIAPDDPWFDSKVYSVEPGLDTHGKEIDFKGQHKLAGADDKYIVVFSSGNYINPSRFEEYSESDYKYFLATVIDRNTYNLVNTIDYAQYISGNGYIQDIKYFNGKITSSVYLEDENGGKVVEMDNDVLTGKKLEQKFYRTHSGYPGGLKETKYKTLMEKKPELAMRLAVRGMLQKNTIAQWQLKRLRVFAGPEHDHAAQKPEVWDR